MATATAADLADLPLHDALLESVEMRWAESTCVMKLKAFVSRTEHAKPHQLVFEGVTGLSIPKQAPWGSSNAINTAGGSPGRFRIEMQSGDLIEVTAKGFRFVAI